MPHPVHPPKSERRRPPMAARRLALRLGAVLIVAASALSGSAAMAEPSASAPKGPIGWDSYRHPERMSEIGSGNHTRQYSSFDRAGSNDDGFDGTYSCLRDADDGCVIAERSGAGEIDSIWFTRDEGDVSKTGNITIELDGKTVVKRSLQELVNGDAGAPFVYPLVANGDQSSGGVYIKVPMPYRESMRITTDNNPLFYHVDNREFTDAEDVTTFDPSDPANDVIDKLKAAGTADPKPARDGAKTTKDDVDVPAGDSATVATATGPGAVTALRFTFPQLSAGDAASDHVLHDARLRISFDGKRTVDAPLGEFFGTGLGLYPVRSLMFGVDDSKKEFTAWWLMPYADSAKVEIANSSDTAISGGTVEVTTAPDDRWTDDLKPGGPAGYFTAIGNREEATNGRDHVFADTTGRGRVVGVTQTVEGLIKDGNTRDYLEGDERLFTDGSLSPDAHGTGTEDFYESGWYFNRDTFTNPMNGNPAHEDSKDNCQYDCTGMYRLFVAESPEFDSSVHFGIEHGPTDNEPAVEGSTTYLYQQPDTRMEWSDTVDVGDSSSEAAHDYTSTDPGESKKLTSGFEGHDGPPSPATLDGRSTSAPVEFTVAIDGKNDGVELRRLGDQNEGYQSAKVAVDGQDVGTWKQPLANKTARWLDDGFELPAASTGGKTSVTVRLSPEDGAAWSAAQYEALSRVTGAGDGDAPAKPAGSADTPSDNAITVTWNPAGDDVYAPTYELYASKTSGFEPSKDNLLAKTAVPGFAHAGLGLGETWYYRVRAVDAAGNAGSFSDEITGVSGSALRVEAESLLPPVDASAPVEAQANCCGVSWSGGTQLWFRPDSADQKVTVEFSVPADGTYELSAAQTRAPDYGITTLALDGDAIGDAVDGYDSKVAVPDPVGYGQHDLTAGKHRLTLTVTGKNDQASGFLAGVDFFDAKLVK